MWSCSHWSHVFHEDFKEQGKHDLYPTSCKLHNWIILFKINQFWYNCDLFKFDNKTSENIYSWVWHHLSLCFSSLWLKSIGHFKCSLATGFCCLQVSKFLHGFLNLNFTGLMIQADFSSSRILTIAPFITFQPNGIGTEDTKRQECHDQRNQLHNASQTKEILNTVAYVHKICFCVLSLQDSEKCF